MSQPRHNHRTTCRRAAAPLARGLAAALCCMAMQGCFFTGVESTPRITGRDVRREALPVAPEDNFLACVGPEPLAAWKPGKAFTVTDSRLGRVLGAAAVASPLNPGDILRWSGATQVTGVDGDMVTDLNFISPAGKLYSYRVNKPLALLMADSITEIPFTIQHSMVDKAAALLEGKELWVLTSYWRDDDDTPVPGRKYVSVTIDSVRPGNALYPLKVAFHDSSGRQARIFMHTGARGGTMRTFGRVFSFDDPRLRYPHITPAHWALIIDGRVADGMTTEECRLALGKPKEVERGATRTQLREVWVYDNGRCLIFEDGLLRRGGG